MKTPSVRTRRRPGRVAARAFTLTELLVVLLILSLLLGILMPSITAAVKLARRKACMSNQSAVVKAANQYALTDRRKCVPTIFDRKDNQGYNKWGDMEKGQPACLWLLVSERQVDRVAFLCAEAENSRQWKAPGMDANRFTYDAETEISTLSFSFISMTRKVGSWKDTVNGAQVDIQLADQMSMDNVPGTLVVLADQNPRCTFGGQTLLSYTQINANEGGKLSLKARRNSVNHLREGQNITRWDGSCLWMTDPNDQNGDDVYTSNIGNATQEKEGRRKDMADPFVLP